MGCFQTGGAGLATAERAAPLRAGHLGLSAELEPRGPQTAELDRRLAWYGSNPGHRSLTPEADETGLCDRCRKVLSGLEPAAVAAPA